MHYLYDKKLYSRKMPPHTRSGGVKSEIAFPASDAWIKSQTTKIVMKVFDLMLVWK